MFETEKERRGTRCHICTGCGRCFGEKDVFLVVADGSLTALWQKRMGEGKAGSELSDGSSADGGWIVAIDIGTTTVAMVLYDERGRERDRFAAVNPQVKYGADVISRIQAAEVSDAALAMRDAVRRVLETGLRRFAFRWSKAGCEGRAVIAANTTMCYLLLGYNAKELGHAPFHASHLAGEKFQLCGVETVLLPGLSAFVGADILAGIYASEMAERAELTLLIDLGTNGEMALGNRNRIIACSTAAGPAFEGGATRGIWGADMVSLTARLLREGLSDETGLLDDAFFEDGVRIGDVLITQGHIRQLQLAKGAIAAGIEILTRLYGLKSTQDISQVVLAGGFGYYLKARDAVRIGLLPVTLEDRVESAGNAALAGALRYGWEKNLQKAMGREEEKSGLKGERMTQNADDILSHIRKITQIVNLAEAPDFQDIFLEAMNLEVR